MLSTSASTETAMRVTHAQLMAHAQGQSNDDALACMLASWRHGGGAMPARLGLSEAWFQALLTHHFPGTDVAFPALGAPVDPERAEERTELRTLLLAHRAHDSVTEQWMAEIVAAACMASDHLWQDLGLWSRKDLTALMMRNFPALATRNDRNMKWKRFLYKQLCESEGIYVCRAPSCEVCADYVACFSPED